MSADLDSLFEAFKASYLAGDGDPAPTLEGLDAADRRRLERRIEDFIESDPEIKVSPEKLMRPDVQAMTDLAVRQLDGAAGGLSALLSRLRSRQEMEYATVIDELALALDANDREKAKIEAYYHDIEYGNLSGRGISDVAFDAIARVFRTKRQTLKAAAGALGPSRASTTGPVFARTVEPGELDVEARDFAKEAPAGRSRRSDPPDRIDRLFTGG